MPDFVDSVICARGESAETFIPVIRALNTVGCVVFVDDGDNSGVELARLAGAQVVAPPYHAGKSFAMLFGLEFTSTDRVIFADADICGFNAGHARKLAVPHDGMIVGLRQGSGFPGPVPHVSGERSLPAGIARIALTGCADSYEAETAINSEIGKYGLPVSTFVMNGVRNPSKQPLMRFAQVFAAVARNLPGIVMYVVNWVFSHFDAEIRQVACKLGKEF